MADRWATTELDGGQVDASTLNDLERDCRMRPMGRGCCLIVNESHGLRGPVIRRLLVLLEELQSWVTVIFTTTADGQESLFEDQIDAHPLLSRCLLLTLASRDLAKPFAKLAKEIAQREGSAKALAARPLNGGHASPGGQTQVRFLRLALGVVRIQPAANSGCLWWLNLGRPDERRST